MRTRLGKLARACAIALALAAALRAWADTHDKVQLWKGGPYWATKNIGAEEPWDFGYYFWWGDTVGYARSGGTWTDSEDGDGSGYYSDVTWVSSAGQQMSSSPFSQSSCPTWGKDNSALLLEHYIDSTGNLLATRDAATEHLGSPWRMPTSDEIQALVDNCTTEWITTNGVYGSLVTGKGAYANRSIFLPAAGSGDGAHLYYPGSDGLYWSSAPNSDDSSGAWNLYFDSDYFNRQGDGRFFGRAVRPVQGVLSTGVKFTAGAVSSSESKTVKVTVYGGSLTGPSSVKVLMAYQTAAAADLDLKNATVNGEPVKGGLKFPLTLAWDTGDTSPVTIEMPVKADKSVEDDETFTFQLADAVGMEVGETQECTVTVNDPSFEELRGKIEEGTATKAESNTWTKASYEGTPYMRGLAYPADGGKVTGSAYCPENKKVTLKATAGKGWKFLGWRQGTGNNGGSQSFATEDYVATTPSLVIDRTTKPAKDTRTSTTLTGITESTTFYAVFEGDPRVTATPVAFKEEGGVVATDGGKVTGAGRYAPGKKVTLKASANKGFAFGGWYDVNGKLRMENGKLVDGEGGPSPVSAETTPLSQSASLSFEMGEEDVDLYARFVTVEEDAGSIAAGLNGGGILPPSEEEPVSLATNVWAGVYLQWPVAADALSQTTVKVSGLPSGLKFTAKDIMKKGSKTKVEIPANTIYGAPTAASKTDKDGNPTPSNVKITVTTAGKSSVTYAIALTVDALPNWAVGSFDGAVEGDSSTGGSPVQGGEENAQAARSTIGTVSLTIATSGKISGKILEGGKTWSLSAAWFDEAVGPKSEVGSPVFRATVIAKAGKEVATNVVTVAADAARPESAPYQCGVATGTSQLFNLSTLQPFNFSWTAYQNLWKRADTKASQPVFKKNIVVEYYPLGVSGDKNNTVKFTFKKDGAVSFSGKIGGVSVSGNAQIVWDGEGWKMTVYAPPKPKSKPPFDGWCETFPVKLILDEQNIVTAVELGGEEPEMVQLWEGGPFWATRNIGAENPEDSGYYFWWGDTIGYKWENGQFVASDGSVSGFSFEASNTRTYNKDLDTLQSEGWTTSDGVLRLAHDAARAHWGERWRMPTHDEQTALVNNCDWNWTTKNGVNGYEVRGQGGFASRRIFLPCCGSGEGTSLKDGASLDFSGSRGYYWSSLFDGGYSSSAWYLSFSLDFYDAYCCSYRILGFPIRPVQSPAE